MIRAATPADYAAIRALLRHTFGRAQEADAVEQLRADGHALVELVAASDIALQGHILYSPLTVTRAGETLACAVISPVTVLPAFQRQGLSTLLIEAGNARCRDLGLAAIMALGHPDYYPQFGFSAKAAESLNAPFPGVAFTAIELVPGALQAGGDVSYAAPFGVGA